MATATATGTAATGTAATLFVGFYICSPPAIIAYDDDNDEEEAADGDLKRVKIAKDE